MCCRLLVLGLAGMLSSTSAMAQIPQVERDALIAFYDSTGGDSWVKNEGWLGAAGTECDWYGVTCDFDGNHVTELTLNGYFECDASGCQSLSIGLTGTIPPELGNLSTLEILDLSWNSLSGDIPSELADLSSLEHLALSLNQLSGSIPTELGNLSSLLRLSLDRNQLAGSIPPVIGNLSTLENLELNRNLLSGIVPSELGNLSSLVYLRLHENQLTGSIPPALGNLSSLTVLRLDSNLVSGSIPPEIGSLPNLAVMFLKDNQLTGSIPPEFGGLSSLSSLNLDRNQLSGTIPAELVDLTSLKYIWLSANQLTGSIPPELGSLSDLVRLSLNDNQLTGGIPAELGNLSDLHYLYVDDNQLTGTIPPELASSPSLWYLKLGQNLLRGSIPLELENAVNLQELCLRSNSLTGLVPSSLVNLSWLQSIDFRWNGLHTNDDQLRAFLNARQVDGDWESTQSVAPGNAGATVAGPDMVTVDWTPTAYTWDAGRYRVLGRTESSAEYQLLGATTDKISSSVLLSGLDQGTTYSLVLQTVTDPHASNQNTVESEYSPEIVATTPGTLDCYLVCTAAVPTTAQTAEAVEFSAMVEAPNCAQAPGFAWSFGDGQVSNEEGPSHAYVGPGTYGWSLTASAENSSCTTSGSITVFEPGAECGNGTCEEGETAWTCPDDCGLGPEETGRAGEGSTRAAVPAVVGGASGIGGTYWVSEAMFHNPEATPASFTVHYTADRAPGEVSTAGPLTIDGGQALFYENLVQELFGVTENGSVRFRSDGPLMLVSRTFNDQPQGTYGQFLGAVSASRALGVGDRAYLLGLREDSSFRTNVILQEVSGVETVVRLTIFRPDGLVIGEETLSVEAFTKRQDRLLDFGFSRLGDAYATVHVTGGGQIVAIASVVDHETGDAMTIDALHRSQAQLVKTGSTGPVEKAFPAADAVGFTWSPHRAAVGETVQFTDLSTGDNTAWSWSFGDGHASNEQHPTNVYSAAGSYTVGLRVLAAAGGSMTATETITVDEIPPDSAHYLVAVVARLAGVAGTQWRSGMWVLNPFATSQRVWLEYRPGNGAVERLQLVAHAGEQLAIEDVVAELFPNAGDGKGSLHVYAAEGVFVSSRTFNLGEHGTFGQAIPALGGGDLLAPGDTGVLLKLRSTSTDRCNVGFTELDGVDASVRVTLNSVDGSVVSMLGSKSYAVTAGENLQVNRIFLDMGLTDEYEAALAEVEVLSGGRVYAYASNVDDRTGDGEFIPAIRR